MNGRKFEDSTRLLKVFLIDGEVETTSLLLLAVVEVLEGETEMEQLTDLLAAVDIQVSDWFPYRTRCNLDIPAGSSLSPLTLESANALLPPLGSHLRSRFTTTGFVSTIVLVKELGQVVFGEKLMTPDKPAIIGTLERYTYLISRMRVLFGAGSTRHSGGEADFNCGQHFTLAASGLGLGSLSSLNWHLVTQWTCLEYFCMVHLESLVLRMAS